MNESEKERLIKKDMASIENRVRHAFNQGYEMGLKESRSEIPNTCDDAISRQAVIDRINKQREGLEPEIYPQDKIGEAAYRVCIGFIKDLPSVTPRPCEDAISRREALNAITMAEVRWQAVDNVNKLPSVMPKQRTGHWIIIDDCEQFIAKCSVCGRIEDSRMISKYPYCHCGAKMEVEE